MNEVTLLGFVGSNAELKYSQAGSAVCNISIATTEKWGDQSKTFWHRITFFGKTAEIWAPQIKKGDEIWIKGKIQPREYEKNGVKHYVTDIIANWVRITMKKPDNGGNYAEGQPERKTWQPPAVDPKVMNESDIPF